MFYLFIFGCTRSLSLYGLFSSCSNWGLLFIAVHRLLFWWLFLLRSIGLRTRGLSSCSSQALEHRLSSCGAHLPRVSYSTACEIFLYQGSNLCFLHWQVDSLPLSHQGSSIVKLWTWVVTAYRKRRTDLRYHLEVNSMRLGWCTIYLASGGKNRSGAI